MTKNDSLSDGEKLARVLLHYGLIESVESNRTKIMCPFHGDKNPSMSVNFDEGFFYCFGCGEHGDAEKFVKKIEKQERDLNDLAALKVYGSIIKGAADGVKLVRDVQQEVARSSQKLLYDQAYDTYHGLKKVSWMSSEEPEVVNAMEYMERRGFTPDTLSAAGAKVTYRKNYQLIFPMRDNGIFKGWVCRTMIKEIEERRKYLYNKGFSRATTLVGDYGPKKFKGVKSKYVIVVEGYMDRLKFIQCGIDNVVAILGWKMSSQQIQKLKDEGINVVVSALDNDEPGRKGTKFLSEHFTTIRWCYLKGLKDPGDMDQMTCDKMYKRTKQKLREAFKKGC